MRPDGDHRFSCLHPSKPSIYRHFKHGTSCNPLILGFCGYLVLVVLVLQEVMSARHDFEQHLSHEVIVDLIGSTTTQSGLRVEAQLDTNVYPLKIQVSDEEMAALRITPHEFHGEWNYTVKRA